jgi:hypothetical protein
MKRLLGCSIIVLVCSFMASCDRGHRHDTRQQRLSDEAGKVLDVLGEIYSRLYVSTNATLTNILSDISNQKGAAFFQCPMHQVDYVINPDNFRWRNKTQFSNQIAVFCPEPHHDRFLVARFNGSATPAKTKPTFEK